MPHIAILGSGFAALTAVRELRRRKVQAEITVISPRDALHYVPSSIWIPSGLRKGDDLTIPLGQFFARHRVRHLQASVTGLDSRAMRIETDQGPVVADQILIATGGRFLKKLPGIEKAIIPCEGLSSGAQIGAALAGMEGGRIAVGFATNPNEPSAMRGGPVFEYLFILDEMLRNQGRRDRFHLTFFSPAARPGQRLGEKAVDKLLAEMARRGIATDLGHKLLRIEDKAVVTEAGAIEADLVLFQPGMTGPAWLAQSDLPLSPGGMVVADRLTRVQDRPGIWVAGDAGSYPGPDWMPKQAHQADLQAQAAAANIASVLKGQTPRQEFRVELVCILDSLKSGMLVFRRENFSLMLPRLRPLHWAKALFEGHYLRAYR